MKILKFNESLEKPNNRYKIDFELLQNLLNTTFYRKKLNIKKLNISTYINSIFDMSERGDGKIYLYSITDDDIAYIKDDFLGSYLHTIPVECLIDFNYDDYKLIKNSKKYNL